jgi:hypothetical protein
VTAATRERLLVGAVAVAAFAIRVAWIAYADFHPTLSDDAGRYDFLGRSLAEGGGYINPNGNTTMFWPPGYPFVLSLVYKLYPSSLLGNHEVQAALVLNAALSAATCVLVYAIARRAIAGPDIDVRVREAAPMVAAVLYALFPSAIFFSGVTLSETAFTLALILALWFLVEAEARGDWVLLACAGFVVGYAALIRGQAALLPVVAVGFWFAAARNRGSDGAAAAARPRALDAPSRGASVGVRLLVVGGLAAAVVLPWTLRNALESHAFVAIASNAGVDFYIGHSADADGSGRKVDELVFQYADLPPAEAEARVSRDGFSDGLDYALHHPLREVTLSGRKVWELYRSDDEGVRWNEAHGEHAFLSSWTRSALYAVSNVYYWLAIALAAAGVRSWFSLRDPVRLLLIALVAYWTLVHVAFFADPRFHAPVVPILCMWAACGAVALLTRIERRSAM